MKYAKYKDSGVAWLGEVPEHWEVTKLKYLGNSIIGLTYSPEEIIDSKDKGTLVLRANNIQNGKLERNNDVFVDSIISPRIKVGEGDILICARNGSKHLVGKNAVVSKEFEGATFGAFNTVYRSEYWQYLSKVFQSDIFQSQSNLYLTTTINQLTIGTLNNLVVPFPTDKDERTAIAKYLDKEVARIDELIRKKELFVKGLYEKRQVVISDTVTKGINPNVVFKPSKINWIREIPEHWEEKRLKYIFFGFESGVSVNSTELPVSSKEIGILKTSCVYNYSFDSSKNKTVVPDDIDRVACQVKADSIIMSRMNTPELVGASGYVEEDIDNLFLPDRLWQTVPLPQVQVHFKWLSFVFISTGFKSMISSMATGTSPSMKNIKQSDVMNMRIILPEYEEQIQIADFIQIEIDKIDGVISKTRCAINKLQEYKKSLVSAVVTGKIKVID